MLIEYVNLNEWTTKQDILDCLKKQGYEVTERKWRKYVERYNKDYCNGINDSYIVHSNHGYKLTKDSREIEQSLNDLRKRALNMLWKVSTAKKALGFNDDLQLNFTDLLGENKK